MATEYRLREAGLDETHHVIGSITTEDMGVFADTILAWHTSGVQIAQGGYPGNEFYAVKHNVPEELAALEEPEVPSG